MTESLAPTETPQENSEETTPTNESKTQETEIKPTEEETNKWYLSEGVEGSGDVPDWFNKKTFKTLSDQAKAYPELRKKLGDFTGAPEEYNIELGDEYKDIKVGKDDPIMSKFMQLAKESNMSQDLFSKIVKTYIDIDVSQNNLAGEAAQNRKESEKNKIQDKIGDKELVDTAVKELCTWYKNNFNENTYESFKGSLKTADDFFRWRAVKEKFSRRVPSSTNQMSKTIYTKEDLRKARVDPRFSTDPEYKKRVDQMYADSLGIDLNT